MGLRLLLVLFIYGCGALFSLRSTVFAAGLFIWNDIFQPLSFAKSHGILPVAQFVFALLLGTCALHYFRGTIRLTLGPFAKALAVLIGWMLITVATSPFHAVAWEEFIRWMKYLLPLFLIHSTIQSVKEVKILTAVLCGSVAIWAAQAGVHCLISGPNIHIGIPGGQMTERNDLTAGAVGTIPILVYFAFSYAWRFRILVRAVCLVAAVLCVCVIFLSLSRGSSIGLFVSLFFYIFIVSRRKIRDFVLVGCFIALAFLLAPSVWYERMSTIEIGAEQKESSAMQRMEAMTGAFHATLDRPVFGWGPAGWLEVAPFYTSMTANPHNIYLKVSSEVGITGLLIYLGIMVMTYVRLLRLVKPANRIGDKDTARLAIAQASCIIGLLSALTFLNAPFGEYLWTWICLANALPGVFRKELAAKRKRVRPEPGLPDLPGLAPATT